eukprot:TRINITY_DN17388_c0_g2_i1.p1 TRINITY_DN17388_c0_g2~~TRINITY_DN17388_c0_g2_i1.p1  ORF type:complete len:792 (+),score=191.15 TRINITY_DN17388_c0_g2_i1:111-2486(+)
MATAEETGRIASSADGERTPSEAPSRPLRNQSSRSTYAGQRSRSEQSRLDLDGESHTKDLSRSVKESSKVLQQSNIAHGFQLLERSTLEDIVRESGGRTAGCLSLIFCFLYFIVFLLQSMLLMDNTNVHLLESPFREALAPTLDEAVDIAALYKWMDDTVLGMFFKQTRPNGTALPEEAWSKVLSYSKLLGDVTLEQTRSEVAPCNIDIKAPPMMCHNKDSQSAEKFGRATSLNGSSWSGPAWSDALASPDEGFVVDGAGRRLRVAREELQGWLPQEHKDAVFSFTLRPEDSIAKLKKRLEYLRERGWLDKQTMTVGVTIVMSNDFAKSIVVTEVKFQFSRGGGIFSTLRFRVLPLDVLGNFAALIASGLFVLLLVIDSAIVLQGLCRACVRKEFRKHIRQALNAFGLANFFLGWALVIGFLAQWQVLRNITTARQAILGLNSNVSDVERRQARAELGSVMDTATFVIQWYHLLLTYYSLFLMFRTFVSMRSQPRLAILVRTLASTWVDLVHFFFILAPTFIAFAIAGMCIFGRRVDTFASLFRSIGTCFKIMIENEFDWQRLSEEDFWTALTWTWSFLLLVCMIMLNMILAIVMDIYSEVRLSSHDSETLWGTVVFQMKRMYLRIVHGKHFMSASEILGRMEEFNSVLTVQEFDQTFPDMIPMQRERILKGARDKAMTEIKMVKRSTFSSDTVAAAKLAADKVRRLIADKRRQYKDLNIGVVRPDAMCVEDVIQSVGVQNHWMMQLQATLDHIKREAGIYEPDDDENEGFLEKEYTGDEKEKQEHSPGEK